MKTAKVAVVSALVVSMFTLASAQSVDAEPGFVQPGEVTPGQDVSNQLFNVRINSLSADGDTDYVYFQFPDRFAGSLSPNTVNSNISVSSSNSIVDYDGDGSQETVQVGISRDGGGNVSANVTLDTEVSYPQDFEDFRIDITVEDSRYGESSISLQVLNSEAGSSQGSNIGPEDSGSTDSGSTSEDSGQRSQQDSSDPGFIGSIVSFFTGLF